MSYYGGQDKQQPYGSYPTAPQGQPRMTGYGQPAPSYQQMPPPYTAQAPPQQMQGPPQYVPTMPMAPSGYSHVPQYPQYYPQAGQQQMYYAPRQQTVVVPKGFDAGARFDVQAPSLPPPPPGCAPTASQIAAAQGHNVVVTQRPDNFFMGGSDGGYTFW